MRSTRRGFTIIELLVVIAIIGLLASIVTASLLSTQQNARDARRVTDIKQIQNALELYSTTNNRFPIATTETTLTGADAVSTALLNAGAFDVVPLDPKYPTYAYTYQSNSSGTDYDLGFCLETDSIQLFSAGCGNTVSP